ncbi:hypothetical protein ABZ468_42880 [Streptomyces sp. NPDC005708]|uniref:hypothetical protein n=1 Tax=Streptomyces sp. NPDC005708 TaxID=3154564 RepID=UPI0033F97063
MAKQEDVPAADVARLAAEVREVADEERDEIADYIEQLVRQAPPLSSEQRVKLAALLRRPDEPAADQMAA